MSSEATTSSEEKYKPDPEPSTLRVRCTARKSTASQFTQGCVKRRQVARKKTTALKPKPTSDDFVKNFEPRTGAGASVTIDSEATTSSEEKYKPDPEPSTLRVRRTARKSTASQSTQGCVKRWQVARKKTTTLKPKPTSDNFAKNFEPRTGARASVKMDSEDTTSSEEKYKPDPEPSTLRVRRTARKSTASQSTQGCVKRWQVARKKTTALKPTLDDFAENFKPRTGAQARKEVKKEMSPPSNVRMPLGALYDENGIHITSHTDLCDCLNKNCGRCCFNCPKCGSQKCGPECRVHRKYVYEEIELDDGYNTAIVNPVLRQ